MKLLREVRKALGLSQTEMAGLLGLDRGQIAMCETGKRKLPFEVQMKIAWMAGLLNKQTRKEYDHPSMSEILEKEIQTLEIPLANLQLELENQEEQEQKAQLIAMVCAEYESAFPGSVSISVRKKIDVLLYKIQLKMESGNHSPAVVLRAKIKGLETTLEELRKK